MFLYLTSQLASFVLSDNSARAPAQSDRLSGQCDGPGNAEESNQPTNAMPYRLREKCLRRLVLQ